MAPTPTRQRPWRTLAASCVLSACTLVATPLVAAQTPKPSPDVAQKPAAPTTPQVPVSLASQPPVAATVTFQNGELTIKASNSELLQILQAITAQTGMKVQGTPGNHRIFGVYGPGKPNDVISSLLSGFDFNYLLVGMAHNGAPQKLILAGAAGATPEPPQPVHSVQPAPPNTLPQPQQPQTGNRPDYQRPPQQQRMPPRAPSAQQRQPANMPHGIRSPQQILKELEAMRAKQKPQPQR